MAPRANWKGFLRLSLVSCPIALFPATSPSERMRFHQINKQTGHRIRMQRIDEGSGEEVPYENIVKGYEISPDTYVVIEPGELETLDPKKTRLIEIEQFVDLAEIDPILYDQPYYLVPATGAAKSYRLMLEAMRESDRVAIARVVLRQKEHLVALRAAGEVMLMETLVFADEVVSPDTLDEVSAGAEVEVSERELMVARQLIEMLSEPFEPEKYRDEYREAVLALIEAKVAGEEVAVAAPAPAPAAVPDLMAALQASVEAVGRYNASWDGEEQPKPKRTRKQPDATSPRKRASTRPTTKKS